MATIPISLAGESSSDRRELVAMCDRAGVDVDVTPETVTLSVNGREVIGSEGGIVIFKFTKTGRLKGAVIWNKAISNTGDSPQ